MPVAINDQGQALRLDKNGQWVPTQRAEHPETGQVLILDGDEWRSVEGQGGALRFVDDVARQTAQGATLGFADEISAFLNSQFTDKSFDELVTAERARDADFMGRHPVVGTGAQVGGAVLSALAMPAIMPLRAAQAAGKLPTLLKGFLGGGATGAIAGAGFSEGGERLEGATLGGLLGAGFGVALPVVMGLVGKFGKTAINPIKDRLGKGPENAAIRRVLDRLAKDDLTLDDALAQMRSMGDDATLADVGPRIDRGLNRMGGSTSRLAESVANQPGRGASKAMDVFTERRAGQVGRLLSGLDDAIGPTGREIAENIEGSAAFVRSLRHSVPVDDELTRLLRRPSMQQAWKRAQKLAAERDIPLDNFDDVFGDAARGRVVEIRTDLLHWLKKGLDDVLEPKRDPVTNRVQAEFGKNELEAMKQTRFRFRDLVKTRNPEYGAQLDKIAATKSIDSAYEKGRAFFKLRRPEDVSRQIKTMSGPQLRAYRRGIRDEIENRIADRGDIGFDQSAVILGQGRKLKAAFGDAGDDLIQRARTERSFANTERRILGGSQTAQRLAEKEDMAINPIALAQAGRDASTGNFLSAGVNAVRGVGGRFRAGNERVRNELAELLMTPGADMTSGQFARLEQQAGLRALREAQKQKMLAAMLAGGGEFIGREASGL